MPFDQIETKKREYTDKYVMVDASRPELARFRDIVGQVKTVNMSGRALVEFMDYHLNIGWYDIDPDYLKIVDKPAPKVAKPEAKKPAAKTEGKPAATAKTPAAKTPAAGAKPGKPSVADILAAARGGKSAPAGEAASAAGKTKSETAPPAEKPAAPKPAAVDRSKMSVADMLAAARAGGAGGAAKPAAAAAAKTQAAAAPVKQETPAEEEVAEAPPAAAPAKSTEKFDKSNMSIADMIDWCRQHDAK
jgi:hypothetical protein